MNIGSLTGYLDLDASGFDESLGGALDKLRDLGGTGPILAAAAGGAIGVAVGAALAGAISTEAANDKLAAQLGLTEAESERVGGVAGRLYAGAYGESLSEVNDAVGAVMSSIKGMSTASDADLQAMTTKVLNLSTAFEVDTARAAQVAGQMITSGLAKDGSEALDLLTASMQKVPAAVREDLFDAVDEYGPFLDQLGIRGSQAMGMLVKASEDGAFGIDKTGDALKEFTIRATDMSASSKVGFDALGLSQSKMTDALLAGGDTAKDAFTKIVTGLQGMKDPAAQSQAALALFGTPLEDLNTGEIPAFLASLTNTQTALGDTAGAADRMGQTLNDNAASNLESFKRSAQTAFIDVIGGRVLPIANEVASVLGTVLGPALMNTGAFIQSDVVPALQAADAWMHQHSTTIGVIAGVIGVLLLPALSALAVQAAVSAAAQVTAWVVAGAGAVAGAATQLGALTMTGVGYVTAAGRAIASFATMAAGWVAAGVTAVANAAVVVGGWILVGLQAGLSALQALAGFAVMAAGWVAAGVVAVANAAVVVGGWVLMGTQSLIQAARMAAAWFIALGPVGWVIAAVIALAALVIANWDTIVDWTTKAWTATWEFIKGAWDKIKQFGKDALDFLVNLFLNFTGPGLIIKHWDTIRDAAQDAWAKVKQFGKDALDGLVTLFMNFTGPGLIIKHWDTIVSTARELPGRILDALSTIGSTVMQIGTDIIEGIKRGIVNGASSLASAVKDAAGKALTAAKDFLGIKSPSRVFRDQVGAMVPAGMAEGILGGVDLVTAAVEQLAALPSNVSIPASVGVGSFAAGDGSLYGTVLAGSATASSTVSLSDADLDRLAAVMVDRPVNLLTEDGVLAASVDRVKLADARATDQSIARLM